jgi:hypothetical protein
MKKIYQNTQPPRRKMNKLRKEKHLLTDQVIAMKVCAPITLGDPKITSKCLKAMKYFKQRYNGEELKDELRIHLYKDIQKLITRRMAAKDREIIKLRKYWNEQLNKIKPRFDD